MSTILKRPLCFSLNNQKLSLCSKLIYTANTLVSIRIGNQLSMSEDEIVIFTDTGTEAGADNNA